MTWENWLLLGVAVLFFVLLIIVTVLKHRQKVKAGKAEDGLAGYLGAILEVVMPCMQAVEGENVSGAFKKEFVLSRIQSFCLSNGLQYNETAANHLIESLIDFSKVVNAEKKDVSNSSQESAANVPIVSIASAASPVSSGDNTGYAQVK